MNGDKNNSINRREKHQLHFVLICDEKGIFDAFEIIKKQLIQEKSTLLSLIYIISVKNIHPLFGRELNILEKRFPRKFLKYYLYAESVENPYTQELIEAIINSNLLPKIQFHVVGNDILVSQISEILRLLDVKSYSLDLKI